MNLAAFTVIIEEPLQLSVKFAHQRGTWHNLDLLFPNSNQRFTSIF
jgi:hypothetical protein